MLNSTPECYQAVIIEREREARSALQATEAERLAHELATEERATSAWQRLAVLWRERALYRPAGAARV